MTLDTNIIIAYIAGEEDVVRALNAWREAGSALFLPAVVESEVLAYDRWSDAERKETLDFLSGNFVFIPFDRSLTTIAADVRRLSRLKFPDAAIAATALLTGTPLVTRNVKDFCKVASLTVYEISQKAEA